MYVLGTLRKPEVPGTARRGTPADLDLVASWLGAFHDEATPTAAVEDDYEVAHRLLVGRRLWMWEAYGEPVALAAVTTPAAGAARVGPVCTPPAQRRRGYGAVVAASASAAGREEGADGVVLYADLANRTSNSIYQAIGYRPDHDAGEWDLVR